MTACKEPRSNADNLVPEEAWWLTKEFEAKETDIGGIQVSQFVSNWKFATALDKKYIKAELTEQQLEDVKQSNLEFSVTASIDGDTDQEVFFVGIYQTTSGEVGRFLAVKSDKGIEKVFPDAGFSGFSALYQEENELRWFKCMQCGEYELVQWNGSDYVLY